MEFTQFNGSHINVEIYAKNITIFLKNLLDKYFPIKSKLISHKNIRAPWVTRDIKKCIAKKHRWAKNGRITLQCYKNYCKSFRYLLKIAEQEYNSSRLESLGSDMRKNWKLLNGLLNRKKQDLSDKMKIGDSITNDSGDIAEAFNDFFIRQPINIHSKIRDSNMDFTNTITDSQNSIFFQPVQSQEIFSEISKIKKLGKLSDISSKFLKLSISHVVPILCDFYNRCIEYGKFPEIFKIASITPILKKGSST